MKILYDNQAAEVYDDWVGSGYYDYPKIAKILTNILGHRKKILELGIGTGNVAIPLIRAGFKIDGIDPSSFMLDKLKEKLDKNSLKIKLYNQSVENFNLKDKYTAAYSFGGAFWIVKISEKFYFETYLKDKSTYSLVLKKIYKRLYSKGFLITNIQHHGVSFKMKFRSGIDYHFVIERKDEHNLIKTHYFDKNGKNLFYRAYPTFRLGQKDALKMFSDCGFKNLGPDKTNSFWIFQKV